MLLEERKLVTLLPVSAMRNCLLIRQASQHLPILQDDTLPPRARDSHRPLPLPHLSPPYTLVLPLCSRPFLIILALGTSMGTVQ